MTRRLALAAIVLAAAAAAAAAGVSEGRAGGNEPTTIFAAASLTEAGTRIVPGARFQLAGSNQLALQIRQGAPADVFLSASPIYTRALRREGLVEKPYPFATNSLVLAVPRSNPARIRAISDLARRPSLRLVVAGPKVPIGLYTREVLKRLGLLSVLRKTVSQEPDVKGIVGKLAIGEADAGFVYATDVRAADGRLRAFSIPRRGQPTVVYEAAVVRRTGREHAAWAALADFLSARGRRELVRAGFGVP